MMLVQEFVAKVQELCEGNGALLLPALQALSGLCLDDMLQVPHGCLRVLWGPAWG